MEEGELELDLELELELELGLELDLGVITTGTLEKEVESHLSKLNEKTYPRPRLYWPDGVIGKVCGVLRVNTVPYP
jgi:hypothetical protein